MSDTKNTVVLRTMKYENGQFTGHNNLINWTNDYIFTFENISQNYNSKEYIFIPEFVSPSQKIDLIGKFIINNQDYNLEDLNVIYMPKTKVDYIFLTQLFDGIITYRDKTFLINTPKINVVTNILPNYEKISEWKINKNV